MDLAAGSPILGRRNGVKKTPGGAGKGSGGGGSGSGNGSGSGMVGIGGVSGSRNGGVSVDDDVETPRGSRVSILSSSRGSKPGACIAAATAATAAAASRSAKKSKTRSNVSRFGEEDAADEFETDFCFNILPETISADLLSASFRKVMRIVLNEDTLHL